jgi:ribosomal protein L7Ae-like RNA K-turn-binding protein
MSVLDALKGVLKLSLMHDGLARGLREASKALDRRQAHMCVLNESCEEEAYKKLVIALCSEHKIPLIKVPDGKQLGEWAGLCECAWEQLGGEWFADWLCYRRPRPRGQRPQGRQLLLRRRQGLG